MKISGIKIADLRSQTLCENPPTYGLGIVQEDANSTAPASPQSNRSPVPSHTTALGRPVDQKSRPLTHDTVLAAVSNSLAAVWRGRPRTAALRQKSFRVLGDGTSVRRRAVYWRTCVTGRI